MDAKTKKYLIIGSIVLLLLIALAWYFYKRGKRTTTIQQAPGQLPGDTSGANVSGASNDELKVLAQSLFQDMDGYNWSGHDIAPYQQALALSDADLIKLYNAYNTLYQADSKQTLKQWIEGEKYFNHEVTDALLLKMAKLNLI